MPDPERGRLVVVGCGFQPSRHASQRSISEIARAEVVFALTDAFALDWIARHNRNLHDLSRFYADDRDRRASYRDMQQAIVDEVRAGRRVCVVFYGHPGVFAQVGRKALAQARTDGFETAMEPGISAEACLYADLDLDPGEHGLQSLEATQLLIEKRNIDPSALLLLWQIAQTGNLACTGFDARAEWLELLVDKLSRWYPRDHEVILYQAATLPIQDFRADRIGLVELPGARISSATTLVVPPYGRPEPDRAVLERLRTLG
ncbi:MAG: SAM-dependent methyltransferase [Wenzhouxiangellaceae bacterium]|nr:SAM-dependent methyltransferase [Wenzhouxiangellaceae bacterium]